MRRLGITVIAATALTGAAMATSVAVVIVAIARAVTIGDHDTAARGDDT